MMKPYADDAASASIGGLTLENGKACVSLYGSLDLTRDKAGLKRAQDLQALLTEVVRVLEADSALPDALPAPRKAGTMKNPFG